MYMSILCKTLQKPILHAEEKKNPIQIELMSLWSLSEMGCWTKWPFGVIQSVSYALIQLSFCLEMLKTLTAPCDMVIS